MPPPATRRVGLFSNLRGDVFGGLTAGIVALPLALGFGVASGLGQLQLNGAPLNGALAGLIGAIVLGIVASVFGGTPSQVSGPTGPMTVVVAGMVSSSTGDPRWLFVTFMLAGALQIILGVVRVGGYVNYLPYPVISGFMTGIGVIIVVIQLPQALGGHPVGSPADAMAALPGLLADVNPVALGLVASTIGLVYVTPKVTQAVPGTLIALVGSTAVCCTIGLEVPQLGEIPSGRPQLALPDALDWNALPGLIVPAVVLALVASIDSLLTSVVADQLTHSHHSSRRELVGQGLGNLLAGLLGGLPGAGATVRTVVNIRSGGRGPLAGVVHGLVLLLVLVGLGSFAGRVPHAVLAGILITVGVGIVDYRGLRQLTRVPHGDAAVMLTTLVLTVTVDLLTAVAAGLVMASILLVKRLADEEPASLLPLQQWASDKAHLPLPSRVPAELVEGIHVARVEGSLFFGNAGPLRRRLDSLRSARGVVLDLSRLRFVDMSGAYALGELVDDLRKERGLAVVIAGVRAEAAATLARLGVAPGRVPADHVVSGVPEGVALALAEAAEREGRAPGEGVGQAVLEWERAVEESGDR